MQRSEPYQASYLGALGFRDAAHAAGLAVCLPDFVQPNEPRDVRGLFNPLLLMSGVVPVPCDLVGSLQNTMRVFEMTLFALRDGGPPP